MIVLLYSTDIDRGICRCRYSCTSLIIAPFSDYPRAALESASANHIRIEIPQTRNEEKSTEHASHCAMPRCRYSDTDTFTRTEANSAEHLDCRIQSECRAVEGRGRCGGGFLDQLLNLAIKLQPAKSAEPTSRERTGRIASANVA